MNRIYQTIRHASTGVMVAVSEITRTHQRSGRNRLMMGSLITACLSLLSPLAFALDEGSTACTTTEGNPLNSSNDSSNPGYHAIAIGIDSCSPGTGSVAIGNGASAAGVRPDNTKSRQTVAIGQYAWAEGDQSISIGADSRALGASSIAIGGDDIDSAIAKANTQTNYETLTGAHLTTGSYSPTKTEGAASIALGMQNTAQGDFSSAMGIRSNAEGFASLAMGVEAYAADLGSTAIGVQASATGLAATAIGVKTKASGQNSVAIGSDTGAAPYTEALGDAAVALGSSAIARADGSIAIGQNSHANTAKGIAGYDITNTTNGGAPSNTTATWQSTYGAVSVGDPDNNVTRQITGLAAGLEDTDAVNVAQLKQVEAHADNLGSTIAAALGDSANYNPDNNQWTAPSYKIKDKNGNAIGAAANNVGDALTSLNNFINQGFKVGDNNHTEVSTITPGDQINFVNGQDSTVHVTQDANGTNISFDFNDPGHNNSPVVYTTIDGQAVYKVGNQYFDNAAGTGTAIDPADIVATVKNADGSTAPTDHATPLAHIGSSIQLASLNSSDQSPSLGQLQAATNNPNLVNNAVNVGDLQRVSHAMADNMATVLGSSVNSDGSVNSPDLQVGTMHYTNFTDAINALGKGWQLTTSVENTSSNNGNNTSSSGDSTQPSTPVPVYPQDTVNFVAGKNISLKQDDKNITVAVANDIQLNSVTTGQTRISNEGVHIGQGDKQVSLTDQGLNNGGHTITNVAPGVNGTDAVNVNQLNNAINNMGNSNQGINRLNNRMDRLENHANAGIAQAIANANLPQAYIPGKSMMSVSGGSYRGETGYAIGVSTISDSGNWVFKASGSGNSRGNYGGGVGAGYQW